MKDYIIHLIDNETEVEHFYHIISSYDVNSVGFFDDVYEVIEAFDLIDFRIIEIEERY